MDLSLVEISRSDLMMTLFDFRHLAMDSPSSSRSGFDLSDILFVQVIWMLGKDGLNQKARPKRPPTETDRYWQYAALAIVSDGARGDSK